MKHWNRFLRGGRASLLVLGLGLAACGAGGTEASNSGGGGGNPGNGGGPGGGGGSGNPLDIVLEFSVENGANTSRTETVRASVPFPKGGYSSLANLIVSGYQTAWMPMQYWPDGTIKIAQAQFTDTLDAGQTKTYRIARDETAQTGSFTQNSWVSEVGGGLQLGAEVRDTFSVAYRSVTSGNGTVLQESPFVRTRLWRTYHTVVGSGGIGRDYLSSTFYATEFRDMPFMLVDWVIGNDYLGADTIPPGNTDPNLRPLGCVDVMSAKFLCKGMSAAQPYRPDEEAISPAGALIDGFTTFEVMQNTYLDDAQTRRYRFLLRFEPPNANAFDISRWRTVATDMLEHPLYPLATQPTWEATEAAGLLGGPIAGPTDSHGRAEAEYQSWANANHFGTWGTHGELLATATTGTPRNGPLTDELGHAIQGQHPGLLQKLEQCAWIQALRPYHLWGLEVGAEQKLLLWDGVPIIPGPYSRDLSHESLGRRPLYASNTYAAYRTANAGQTRAHGWQHFDHEHWSCDVLFDYWTISGDAWAKEELRQLGESLKALMRIRDYSTAHCQAARAEGWCMQGMAQVYQVTQDATMKDYAMRRVNEVVDVERNKTHPSRALKFQPTYNNTHFPGAHEFFMPWQHGALLYGYLGAYRCFEEPILLQISEDVIPMLDYSWIHNYQDPGLGFVASGIRYYVPVSSEGVPIPVTYWDNTPGVGVRFGSSALGGVQTFLIGGLHFLAEMTSNSSIRASSLDYGGQIMGTLNDTSRWDKWNFVIPTAYDN
ncbi:MAG: hypothetical protein KA020_03620 [Planctomycetes bacterium]|jgi:hypothetical protein|nr:hypothetical protein [Planctomycetota bacterium]